MPVKPRRWPLARTASLMPTASLVLRAVRQQRHGRGHAGTAARAGAGAQGARQAALGGPVRAGHPPGRAGLSGIASLARAAGRQQGAAEAAGRRGLFLRARRPALAGGACAEESRVRPNAARDRGARRRRLLPWRDRARYRRGRARSRQARRSESGRPGGLSGQASRAGLRRVPGLRAVRHGAAQQRSAGGVADAGRAGAVPHVPLRAQ